ncbi:MAG: DUF5667 domain-containing protein [Chloroflexota bacterium]|nr:DUF5667 domain-containing protein [Chloroflexota bacterium]MDQ5865348.1 DUF5667 domain-containing protein [Chloroflexota bacterium]
MDDETLQDALDYCIFNPDGLEMDELLAKFPESREELVPLLALCGLISEAVPPVPQERREAMKGRLQDAALARQQAMTASGNGHHEGAVAATLPVVTVEPEPAPRPITQPVRLPGKVRVEENRPRRNFLADWLRRPAFAAAAFAALLLAFIWGLSASSLPDSPFYNVKLLGESIALNVQTSPEGELLKHDELANIRLREIEEMDRRGKLAQAGGAFANYAEHLREGQEILSGTRFSEQQQERLARALYATSTTGEIKLAGLDDDMAGLPEPMRESLSETRQLQQQVRAYSADVLEDLGVEPLTTLPPQTQDALKQTPGPGATSAPGGTATAADSSPTSLGSGSGDAATATRTASNGKQPDRTATYVASNLQPSATSTSTRSSTATATHTSVPAASATRTATSQPSATSTTRSEASPLASTPTRTPTTRPGNGATVTPPRGKPTETRRPESTRTPGRPPTHTPRPEKTKEKGDDSTATAISTSTYTPVPVPPSNTPVPTDTLVPSGTPTERTDNRPPTHTPKPKELEPTNVPTEKPTKEPTEEATEEPTREPTKERVDKPTEPPSPVSACDVDVKAVAVGCGSGDCIEWSALLENKATEPVEINWVAEMQVDVAGGPSMNYKDSGTVLVRPGEESITGTFCESLPESTKKIRVVVRTDTGADNCDSRKQDSIDPCKDPDPKEPEPSATQSAGPPTQVPVPTQVILPTQVSLPTHVSLPTNEPAPTKTPKPR